MSRYHWLIRLLRERLIRLIWLLPLAMAGLFTLIKLAPVDPVQAYVGARVALVGPEQRAAIAKAWGLNDPVPEQFLRWLSHLLQGDLGDSMLFNAPVSEVIMARWPASLSLIGTAFLLAFVIGTSLGLIAAATRGRWSDRIIRAFAVTLAVSPSFWLALMLIALFAVQLGWLPACCSASPGLTVNEVTLGDRMRHLILPAITVSIVGIAPLILHTRARATAFLEGPAARHLKAHGARDLPLLAGPGLRHALGPRAHCPSGRRRRIDRRLRSGGKHLFLARFGRSDSPCGQRGGCAALDGGRSGDSGSGVPWQHAGRHLCPSA